MANGTIAFDTLTTSDSKNTGTEKSIDTSYIFNGVNKVWFTLGMDAVQDDSFNCSSVDDELHAHHPSLTHRHFAATRDVDVLVEPLRG